MNLASEHSFSTKKTETTCCCTNSLSSRLSHHTSKKQDVDRLVSKELAINLNKLSLDEREQILQDIHGCAGVESSKKEEPTFIETSLKSLEETLRTSKAYKPREAYDLAMSMDQQYVENRNFRLQFLRVEKYVIQNAAKRIFYHFKLKLELFGQEKLVKDITFDDLGSEGQRLLCAGTFQFLGAKDSKGRTIVFLMCENQIPGSWKGFARARWYQWTKALNEESAQVDGFILVLFWNSRSASYSCFLKANKLLRQAVPVRYVAFHSCFINSSMPSHMLKLLDAVGEKLQLRMRCHVEETHVTALYTLQSFGINPSTVPICDEGRAKTDLFLELVNRHALDERKQLQNSGGVNGKICNQEETDNKQSLKESSIIPTSRDALLGKGKQSSHPGNLFLEKLIEIDVSAYQQAHTKFEKTCIVFRTMKRFEESGGRFLNPNIKSREWFVADDISARESISARFRYKCKKKRNVLNSV